MEKNTGIWLLSRIAKWSGIGILLYLYLNGRFGKLEKEVFTTEIDGEKKKTLIIDDNNRENYVIAHPNDANTYVVTIPNEVDVVFFDTKLNLSVHNIMPQTGDFYNGKEILIGGNCTPYQSEKDEAEEYQFSTHIYSDMYRNNGGSTMWKKDYNFVSLTCWRKIWWFNI